MAAGTSVLLLAVTAPLKLASQILQGHRCPGGTGRLAEK
jgi:hypothetical protein